MLGPGVSNVTADSHNVLQEGRSRDELREREEGGGRREEGGIESSKLKVMLLTYWYLAPLTMARALAPESPIGLPFCRPRQVVCTHSKHTGASCPPTCPRPHTHQV